MDVSTHSLTDRIAKLGNPALTSRVTKTMRLLSPEKGQTFATHAARILDSENPDPFLGLVDETVDPSTSDTDHLASKVLGNILDIACLRARLLLCKSAQDMFETLNAKEVRGNVMLTNETYWILIRQIYAEASVLSWAQGKSTRKMKKDLRALYIRAMKKWKPVTTISLSHENIAHFLNIGRLL